MGAQYPHFVKVAAAVPRRFRSLPGCRPRGSSAKRCGGFTLLEVILSLGLSTFVMAAVGGAVYVHLKAFDMGRSDVEEAQIARTILNLMADDIRGAVPYDPIRADQLAEAMGLTSSSSSSTSSSTSSTTSTTDTTTTDTTTTDQTTTETTTDTTDATSTSSTTSGLAETSVPSSMPGILGDSVSLQVDVCHLPQGYQYNDILQAATLDTPVPDWVSNMKTVAYFIRLPSGFDSLTQGTRLGSDPRFGLVRRELSRAATLYDANMNGMSTLSSLDVPPIAPEVVELKFQYWDGVSWSDQWDTASRGNLPSAIQISMGIVPAPKTRSLSAVEAVASNLLGAEELHWYYLTVHLPGADRGLGQNAASELGETEYSDLPEEEEVDATDATTQTTNTDTGGS